MDVVLANDIRARGAKPNLAFPRTVGILAFA
jgi:hypothetical protein